MMKMTDTTSQLLKEIWEKAAQRFVDSINTQQNPEVIMSCLISEIVARRHLLIVSNPDIDHPTVLPLDGWDRQRIRLVMDIAQNPHQTFET